MQCLTIIAFHHGKIDIGTIKILLSAGPAFFILNFIECTLSISLFMVSLLLVTIFGGYTLFHHEAFHASHFLSLGSSDM
jgi:hypothetical protein